MKKLIAIASFYLMLPLSVMAAGGPAIELEPAQNNLRDQDSLQRGAVLFSNYCMACHSLKYMRYNRIARDIGWSDEEVVAKMAYGQNKVVDDVTTRMLPGVALDVLGTEPPDLSLMARLKGTDYIYTFLRAYHQDENGNWDNTVLKGTSMPNVLEGIQRHASSEDYAQAARDIANFLEYAGEPGKMQRLDLGWKVIAFLLVLLLLTYILKKEYWRDIKH
ncbi:cytochrome c1 [Thiomicrorhabdus sp. zzn3]|uniref:cytochrome c1 n=1 Tax=Thiomicrorhabdus sp. zzn3 TaxID=3039775 RepID=UPI0024368A9F|nr:cytochrome c1 [Thiomicrorhabdus sp. zzn3]MDG6777437.1 cytochrome c1 [Thiomicrorhabdus sp. zzn3]